MAYIDGFILPVPAANKDAYHKVAADFAPVFKEMGATRVVETWGEDVPAGKLTDFQRTVKAEDGEVIVFSWLEYPSRAVRDAANAKMSTDPRVAELSAAMPFDGKRMLVAGFEVLMDAGPKGTPTYVDGSILAVPTASKTAYQEMSIKTASIFTDAGALRVVETWGDDVPGGPVIDYRAGVKASTDETVVYCWIEWPSKEVRDAAWPKVMSDPRMHEAPLYDQSRRVFGGFRPMLDV